ncbi:hypothetical protein Tco_0466448 [Tanacetum coccineum]
MDITGVEQIALDDTLVAPANRLKIDKSNFRLSSDLKSKEATLQVVYDDLKLTPYYKAFQITSEFQKFYMQRSFMPLLYRKALQICPKLPNPADSKELPFE